MVVVFDLDGTLIDSTEALLTAHDAAWASQGRTRPPDDQILAQIGLPLVDIMQHFAPELDPEPLIKVYSEAYVSAAVHCERIFAGMDKVLNRPFRAAVATGKGQRGAENAVRRHGLESRFEVILGADSVARPKPYPDMLEEVMRRTGTRDLVMIGDTTFDLEMAQRAGVRAIGVSWGHHSIDRLEPLAPVVKTVEALDQMLQRITSSSL